MSLKCPLFISHVSLVMYLQVTKLTEFLIDNCPQIFGEDVLALYGDSDEDELSDNQGNFFLNVVF